MNRILRLPVTVARTVWSFINPSRTAGRLPLGRLAIAVQVLVAIAFVGYTLNKKAIRLPFSSDPYQVQVLFADAQGLDRLDEPPAAVAGTPLGRVTKVTYQNGRALVTLTLDPDVKGKVFADATAAIRPASAIQNLLVNIDPGTPSAGPLPEGEPIPPERTTNYVAIDDLTSILNADTRAWATIVIQQAEEALRGRAPELRRALGELSDLLDTATPISEALAERRRLLTRLVGELEVVAKTLGDRGRQLGDAVAAGSRTLAVTAAREPELTAVTRGLAPLLLEADRAIGGVRRLTVPLLPALDRLAPAAAPLADSLGSLRRLLPRADQLTDRFARLVVEGSEPLALLRSGSRGLVGRARSTVPVMKDLTALTRRLDRYKGGLPQLADTLSGAFSRQDRNGALAAIDILKIEPIKPENFGFPAAARRDPSQRARLERDVALALELACRENALACLARFITPGLPQRVLTGGAP